MLGLVGFVIHMVIFLIPLGAPIAFAEQRANSKFRALSFVGIVVGVHGDSGKSLGGFVGFIVGIS
jgi:hypothetical protein